MRLKAAIFDLDDTLFDCTGTLVEAARRRAAKAIAEASASISAEQAYQEIVEAYRASGPHFDAIQQVASEHELGAAVAKAALEAYQADHVEEIKPFPDVVPTLDWLKDNGFSLFLVSSGNPARQQRKLDQLGIEDFFDEVHLTADDSDKSSVFSEIMRRRKLSPDEVICVGDRIQSEIKIGNALEISTIRILHGRFSELTPSSPQENPRFSIKAVGELRPLIEGLSAAPQRQGTSLSTMTEELDLIQAVAEKIASGPDVDEVLKSIIEGSTELLQAERGSIMILEQGTNDLRIKVSKGIEPRTVATVRIKPGESISGHVARTGNPVVIDDIETDPRFARKNREGYMTRSAVCVPMKVKGKVVGVINMADRKGRAPFTQSDLPLATLIANQAAIALENARLFQHYLEGERLRRELELAADIQRGFLPAKPPEIPGIDIAARNVPSRQIGGDYYDFFLLPEGGLAITIADVSGHGIGPALLMAAIRTAVHAYAQTSLNPPDVLRTLNNLLLEDKREDSFVTLLMATFSSKDGSLVYSSAGHDYPIWYRPSTNEFVSLQSTAVPLGIFSGAEFPLGAPVQLLPGDVVAFFTDGLVDQGVQTGSPFGRERVQETIKSFHSAPAERILDSILQSVMTHCSIEYCDDMTLIVMKIESRG